MLYHIGCIEWDYLTVLRFITRIWNTTIKYVFQSISYYKWHKSKIKSIPLDVKRKPIIHNVSFKVFHQFVPLWSEKKGHVLAKLCLGKHCSKTMFLIWYSFSFLCFLVFLLCSLKVQNHNKLWRLVWLFYHSVHAVEDQAANSLCQQMFIIL